MLRRGTQSILSRSGPLSEMMMPIEAASSSVIPSVEGYVDSVYNTNLLVKYGHNSKERGRWGRMWWSSWTCTCVVSLPGLLAYPCRAVCHEILIYILFYTIKHTDSVRMGDVVSWLRVYPGLLAVGLTCFCLSLQSWESICIYSGS